MPWLYSLPFMKEGEGHCRVGSCSGTRQTREERTTYFCCCRCKEYNNTDSTRFPAEGMCPLHRDIDDPSRRAVRVSSTSFFIWQSHLCHNLHTGSICNSVQHEHAADPVWLLQAKCRSCIRSSQRTTCGGDLGQKWRQPNHLQ